MLFTFVVLWALGGGTRRSHFHGHAEQLGPRARVRSFFALALPSLRLEMIMSVACFTWRPTPYIHRSIRRVPLGNTLLG